MPHIDLLPGAYQGSLGCTAGPSTQIFLPETSPSPSDVAHEMGVLCPAPDAFPPLAAQCSRRGTYTPGAQFKDAFPSQAAGDACLMEGGIVHRGPSTKGERTSPGRLQLFWVVTPTYHFEHYSSDSQSWVC